MQGGSYVEEVCKGVPSPQPCLLVREEDWFLVIERKIIFKIVKPEKAVSVLFASFFVLNTHYPDGCDNFYSILEHFFFNKAINRRKPRIFSVITQLSNV